MIAELNNNICTKLQLVNIGVDYYEFADIKWAWVGSKIFVNSVQNNITNIEGNKIFVNNPINTGAYHFEIEKISQIYENERVIDILQSLSVKGYYPFAAATLINSDEFREQYQCIVAFPYFKLNEQKAHIIKCIKYASQLIDSNRRTPDVTISEASNIVVYPNYSADFNSEYEAKFNCIYAAVTFNLNTLKYLGIR